MTERLTVREAREQHDPPMTQEQLAERSGVDQTYISLIERLLRNPSDDIKARLATALGISPSSLRFAEPLPDSTVSGSYDREGQGVSPTPEPVMSDADVESDDRRGGERRDGQRRAGDRRRPYERRTEAR